MPRILKDLMAKELKDSDSDDLYSNFPAQTRDALPRSSYGEPSAPPPSYFQEGSETGDQKAEIAQPNPQRYLHGHPFSYYTPENLKPLVFHHLQQPNQVEGLAVDETGELYLRDPADPSRLYPIKSWDEMSDGTRQEIFNVLCQYEHGLDQCDEWEEFTDNDGKRKFRNVASDVVKEDLEGRKDQWWVVPEEGDGKYQYTNAAGDTVEFKPSELFADSQWKMVKADLPLLDYYYTNSKGKSAWKLWDWSKLQNKDPLGPLL